MDSSNKLNLVTYPIEWFKEVLRICIDRIREIILLKLEDSQLVYGLIGTICQVKL